MTTKPELKLGSHLLPGLAAVALFAVFAATFLTASFGDATGFPTDAHIPASIGYAMFNIGVDQVQGSLVQSEGFLVAFEIIDLVLVAALAAAVLLARREKEGRTITALVADGGRELSRTLTGDDESPSDAETGGDR
jgi:NADH-quinone oxidoreductase subunit J